MTATHEAGIYPDIPEADYFADPALSASGAKVLLKSPARFHHEQDNPRPSTDAMDVGTVAHHLILHRGGKLHIADAYDWRKPANQQARDNARAAGAVAIHRGQLAGAARIARAVRRHPLASKILTGGTPEVSLWWEDEATGVRLRGRIDYLRGPLDAPTHIVDLKKARDASPAGFAKAAADYGYRESLANYRRGVAALTGRWLPVVLVVVEPDPPHLVAVYTLDQDDLAWGEARMDEAIKTYLECEATGQWPGYSLDVEVLTFPNWAY